MFKWFVYVYEYGQWTHFENERIREKIFGDKTKQQIVTMCDNYRFCTRTLLKSFKSTFSSLRKNRAHRIDID